MYPLRFHPFQRLRSVLRNLLFLSSTGNRNPVEREKDKQTDFLRDMQLLSAGIMNDWEFRMKWMNEDEATAKAALPKAQDMVTEQQQEVEQWAVEVEPVAALEQKARMKQNSEKTSKLRITAVKRLRKLAVAMASTILAINQSQEKIAII